MGNAFEFIALKRNDPRLGKDQIACAIDSIEIVLTFSDDSVTNKVNENAGKPSWVPWKSF